MARDVPRTITENAKNHVFNDVPTVETMVETITATITRRHYKRTHDVPVVVKPVPVSYAPFYIGLMNKVFSKKKKQVRCVYLFQVVYAYRVRKNAFNAISAIVVFRRSPKSSMRINVPY